MKTLTPHEMEHVNGAGIIGSGLAFLGVSITIAKPINDIENSILEGTIGLIPGIGGALVDLLRDPFGALTPKYVPVTKSSGK